MSKQTEPDRLKRMISFLNCSMLVFLCLCVMQSIGCHQNESDPELLLPVRGKIFLNGKPLSGATVTFLAVGGKSPTLEAAFGTTDETGVYQLQTLRDGEVREGASPGSYRVLISRLVSSDGTVYRPDPNEPPLLSGFSESLPSRYSDSMATELAAVVSEASNDLNFSLTDSPDRNDASR